MSVNVPNDRVTELTLPAQAGTRLITDANSKQVLTSHRETDSRTALTRGLAEYLETLSIDWHGGRHFRLLKVFDDYADPEDVAEYPSACVYSTEPGAYEDSSLSPQVFRLDDGLAVKQVAEKMLGIYVEIWATSRQERMALTAMCEDAFDPVDWMTGFRLELPHYFNTRATYEKMRVFYDDSGETAQRRERKTVFELNGHVTQYAVIGDVSDLEVRLQVEVDEG